jgi:uncharacterized protein
MQLEHDFIVPVGVDDAWRVLLDIERIAPCMPGAALTSVEGDDFAGTVKVKVGPITVTYRGTGRIATRDDEKHVAVIQANGKESRGIGTARATITATLYDDGASTRVVAVTDLAVTGRPAQFGRSVLADVGAKLVGQFANCLAEQLSRDAGGDLPEQPSAEPSSADQPAVATATSFDPSAVAPREVEPIDVLQAAGVPLLKRALPVLAAAAAVVLLLLRLRRRSRR